MGHAGTLVLLLPTLAASRLMRRSAVAANDPSCEISLILFDQRELSTFQFETAIREAASHHASLSFHFRTRRKRRDSPGCPIGRRQTCCQDHHFSQSLAGAALNPEEVSNPQRFMLPLGAIL
jgi:hypothetical protein